MIQFKLDTPIEELVEQVKKDMVFDHKPAPSEFCEVYAEIIKYCMIDLKNAKANEKVRIHFFSKPRIGNFDKKPLKHILNFDKSQLVFSVYFDRNDLYFSHEINFDFDLFNVNFYNSPVAEKISALEMKIKSKCKKFNEQYEYPDNLGAIAAYIQGFEGDWEDKKFSLDEFFRQLHDAGFRLGS